MDDGAPAWGLSLWSLLLLALFPGTGGARELFALGMPGTGGAPPNGDGPGPPLEEPATIGADLSFVTVFLRDFPFVISDKSAP